MQDRRHADARRSAAYFTEGVRLEAEPEEGIDGTYGPVTLDAGYRELRQMGAEIPGE